MGSRLSGLPRVAAWLAGAALLAGAMAPGAFAQTDEAAMAVPRLAPFDGDGLALPRPLAAADAALLARLFAELGGTDRALASAVSGLDLSRPWLDGLLGHLRAARLLDQPGRAKLPALAAWLARYRELPDAPAIAALIQARDPAFRSPLLASAAPADSREPEAGWHNSALGQTLRQRLHDGQFDAAERLIAHAKGASALDTAVLQAALAQGLFTANRGEAAMRMAAAASLRGGGRVALAEYVAGLAQWRLGDRVGAGRSFEAAWRAPIGSGAQKSAAAFWAARARLGAGDLEGYARWMKRAGRAGHSFYGLLALRMTGPGVASPAGTALLGEADIAAVSALPGGMRAFALLQIGQPGRALAELRQLGQQASSATLRRSVLLVAERAGLHDLRAEMGAGAAGVAVPRLRPRHGFSIDPALVYALARVESNFDAGAVSTMGAQGLMQLMPETANYMSGRPAGAASGLRDPSWNLELGQRYVQYLASQSGVDGDLIRLLASYNSGPAAFGRWGGAIRDGGDPLMFIEAIPIAETRAFVQQALAFDWLYAARLRLPSPSLDALASGWFPRFAALAPASVH